MWGNFEHLAFDILNKGGKIGLTGGGDCHEARAGYSSEDPEGQGKTPHTFSAALLWKSGVTAALMPELNREALIQALREGRTYATTSARMLIDFSVSDIPMGGQATVNGPPQVSAEIHGAGPIDRIEIIRNGI
jgi:hypothetical protein